MTKKIDLDFCFKGNRKYVHGTDIAMKLIKSCADEVKNIDIAFHAITVNNMCFSTEKPEGKDVKVTFRCIQDENKVVLFGIENNTSIECRYEYFEESIVDNSIVDITEKSIILNTPTEYSFIEHIVAMNKSLLESIYTDINGKWYFTRLEQKYILPDDALITVKLIKNFSFRF